MINLDQYPPNYQEGDIWFPIYFYEGNPMRMMNECREYYQDPLKFHINNIKLLLKAGYRFITWREFLANPDLQLQKIVVLQYDLDGGVRSMQHIKEAIFKNNLNILANIVFWRRNTHYTIYEIEEVLEMGYLQELEKKGWCMGYHNNVYTNLNLMNKKCRPTASQKQSAHQAFKDDIEFLRQYFTIEYYTNHGGNSPNRLINPPPSLGVRTNQLNREAFSIPRLISDGRFQSVRIEGGGRKKSMIWDEQRASITYFTQKGLSFLWRCHPSKYGNFYKPYDFPPMEEAPEIEKTNYYKWLKHRGEWSQLK